MTEVSRQFDHRQARISRRQHMELLRGRVTAAVVDEDQFVRQTRRLECHRQALVERRQVLLLVEQGNDDGHIMMFIGMPSRRPGYRPYHPQLLVSFRELLSD